MFKRLLKSFLTIVVALVVSFEVIGVSLLDHLMFVPQMIREKYTADAEGYVNIGDEKTVIAAVVLGPKKGKKAILYCHGNGENMYQAVGMLKELAKRGFTVAGIDYPGYGLSSGKPTEKGCYRNVHRLYDWLIKERGFDPKDIIVYGFSIGTGSAVELASTKPVGGVILEAPFLSAPRVVTRVRLLVVDPFPNAERVEKGIKCPMMILHGTDDRVVPFWHGKELHRLAEANSAGFYRKFVAVKGADHGEVAALLGIDKYLDLVADFVEGRGRHCGEAATRETTRRLRETRIPEVFFNGQTMSEVAEYLEQAAKDHAAPADPSAKPGIRFRCRDTAAKRRLPQRPPSDKPPVETLSARSVSLWEVLSNACQSADCRYEVQVDEVVIDVK